jgi:hypothetical protein
VIDAPQKAFALFKMRSLNSQLDDPGSPIEVEVERQTAVEKVLKASRLSEVAATTATATAAVPSATHKPALRCHARERAA